MSGGEKTPWVIVIEDMDDAKALEIGKVLGSRGVTGRFCRGSLADVLARNVKGGEDSGSGSRDDR